MRRCRGLYAAGELVGGLFYYNYPGSSGLMAGAMFGRIAGREAAVHARATRLADSIFITDFTQRNSCERHCLATKTKRLQELIHRQGKVLAILHTPTAQTARIMEQAGCEAAFVGHQRGGG